MTDKEFDLKLKTHLLEQAKHESELRHKWIQENHWSAQRLFWIVAGTAGALTAMFGGAVLLLKAVL